MKSLKRSLTLILLVVFASTSCVNPAAGTGSLGFNFTEGSTVFTGSATLDLVISNVSVDDSGTGAPNTRIFFDTGATSDRITNYCDDPSVTGGRACVCRFTWSEYNDESGVRVTINRTVRTDPTLVRQGYVECPVPEVYNDEIEAGTGILISVTDQNSSIQINPFLYEKGAEGVNGDFTSADGKKFLNVRRYSCFETYQKGLDVRSAQLPIELEDRTVRAPSATQFCFNRDGSSSSAQGCDTVETRSGTSAQGNYYNLFVPSNVSLGEFEIANERYYCPRVYESLQYEATGNDPRTGDFPGPRPYPLDQTFSLAAQPSSLWNVGVQAPSVLRKAGVAQTQPSACFSSDDDSPSFGDDNSAQISPRCIGYAKEPEPNGSCSPIRKSTGEVVNTYRLRRFVAMYPPSFDTNGEPLQEARAVDVIYVLDRPVDSGDPSQPYSMYGPKPCPFAYFDREGILYEGLEYDHNRDSVATPNSLSASTYTAEFAVGPNRISVAPGRIPHFRGTSRFSRDPVVDAIRVNPDGTIFPNIDSPAENSCSAAFPIPYFSSTDLTTPQGIAIGSSTLSRASNDPLREVFVRPMEPWSPHYVEDEDFKACAPPADPFLDPPLHFAKDTRGNISWCAAVYPTQSPKILSLEREGGTLLTGVTTGFVKNYTSPVIKNIFGFGGSCTPTNNGTVNQSLWLIDQVNTGAFRIPNNGENHPLIVAPYIADNRCGAPSESLAYDFGEYWHQGDTIVDQDGTDNFCSDQTCDRTIENSPSLPDIFPLQAEPRDIEHVLVNDSSYNCAISYDAGGPKSSEGLTPSTGCCPTPLGSNFFTNPADPYSGPDDTAHLETESIMNAIGGAPFRCDVPEY